MGTTHTCFDVIFLPFSGNWHQNFFKTYSNKVGHNRHTYVVVDVSGSMHHSRIHTEKSNKMQQCIRIYYSMFIWSSTCFRRHNAHHQEPKTVLAALVLHMWKVGRWDCWTASSNLNVQPFTYVKPEAASTVLGSWWWVVCRLKHVELHINME
jgi:hypothetical protein